MHTPMNPSSPLAHQYPAVLSWLCSALLATAISASLSARDIYVSPKGDDSNPGSSESAPLQTLQKANDIAMPGDTVWVMGGTYRNSPEQTGHSAALLAITKSGTPDAWITWRNFGDDRPELIAENCGYAIHLTASYIVIDGLTLTGNNDNVRQADAERNAEIDVAATRAAWKAEGAADMAADYSSTPSLKESGPAPAPRRKSRPRTFEEPSSLYNNSGIGVDTRRGDTIYHHHVLRNLVIRKFGTAGIALLGTDYGLIENCEIYDNAWYGRYGSSGVAINSCRSVDEKPGYRIIARNNRIWNNKNLVRCFFVDHYTDGNGLILDSLGNYPGGALVENNLVYNNGGAGIHIYKSHKAQIDVVNNTLWRNQQLWQLYDLGAHNAANIRFLNNIVVADKYRQVNGKPGGNIVYDYNVYSGSPLIGARGENDIQADPLFRLPSTNRQAADFSLLPGSPAIGTAGPELVPKTDLAGTPRPPGKADRGAFQSDPDSSSSPAAVQ